MVGQMPNARPVVGSAGWVRAGPSKGEKAALPVRPYGGTRCRLLQGEGECSGWHCDAARVAGMEGAIRGRGGGVL